jgi:hypothetical protein
MPRVDSLPCHNLQFEKKTDNILQQEGKEEQVLDRAEITHQEVEKCQSYSTDLYFISHLVPHHLQHYTIVIAYLNYHQR